MKRAIGSELALCALTRGHRLRLLGGLLCLAVVATASALYAYLSGPLLALLLSGGTQGQEYFLQLVPPAWLPTADAGQAGAVALVAVAALLVTVALAKGLAQLGAATALDGAAERIGHQLRARVYEHLLRLPISEHRRRPIGDLVARLIGDVRAIQDATIGAVIGLLRDGLAAVALLVVALLIAPQLALVALAALPLVGLVVTLLSRRVRRSAARGQRAVGDFAARAHAGLAALREVKSCNAEHRELTRATGHSAAAALWAQRRIRARACAPLANEVLAAVGIGGALIYAGGLLSAGAIAPERVISFFTAILLLYRPVKGIGATVQTMAVGRASVERVSELLEQPREREAAEGLPALRERFELRQVSFRYPDGQWSLSGVDLVLRRSRIVALAGPSGAGKTTLANLVCGLERPQAGNVLWDAEPLADRPLAALRAQVALVPQAPLLLDGSLAENLRFGAPGATDGQLVAALEAAALGTWYRSLGSGLDTLFGAGGQQLSAGQAQRLAVARALLRRASVLVLDEPTSALDEQSARLLVQAVRGASRERAVLVVAHTRIWIDEADEVVWISDGRPSARPAATASAAAQQEREGEQQQPASPGAAGDGAARELARAGGLRGARDDDLDRAGRRVPGGVGGHD